MKAFFYKTVIAQAQTIEFGPDRIAFTFLPAHRTLREQLEQNRPWLESIAATIVGRKIPVTAAQQAAAGTAPAHDLPAAAPGPEPVEPAPGAEPEPADAAEPPDAPAPDGDSALPPTPAAPDEPVPATPVQEK